MTNTPSIDLEPIASGLAVSVDRVWRTLALLDEDNTVAFITRYRKDQTGGLDEEQIRTVQREATQARQLADRKASILKLIDVQGKLTPGLRKRIESARSSKRLEDLYLPFKTNKQSLASLARQRGLGPLADEVLSAKECDLATRAKEFLSTEHRLETTADVLAGVKHIIAEGFGERSDVRGRLREIFVRTGKLVCSKHGSTGAEQPPPSHADPSAEGDSDPNAPGDAVEGEATFASKVALSMGSVPKPSTPKTSVRQRKRTKLENSLRDYFDYSESIGKIPAHRVLAINRGERAKILRVRIEGDLEALTAVAVETLVDKLHPHAEFLSECVRSALSRSIVPSLERELRREMSEAAETHAVSVFAKNLRTLFLQRPVHGRRVLAIDPGFKSGCKLAALDEFGGVLRHETVFLIGDEGKRDAARAKVAEFVMEHDLSVIAIGNGTACRDAEQMVAATIGNELQDRSVEYVIVNEAGASVYSTSAIGREELPEFDATIRSAVSIGRRLLDPLSELVKITPANIGVGMYQHDVKAKHLRESLDAVVESCVNFVGVDVNTASPSLLSYVSGLNQLTARRLYEYRLEHGPFQNREQIREVPGIGETTFVQAAGFLRITGGDNPLDATWIHPESYDVAKQVLERLGSSIENLAGIVASDAGNVMNAGTDSLTKFATQQSSLENRSSTLNEGELAAELGVGELSLRDILDSLAKPGRDPREDLPAPTFRSGIIKIDDIEPGMELAGTVLNVVDFGAFVDIGICETSLIHISRLADRFVRDPHEVASIGDVLRVWVLEVDRERRRVKLTAIPPDKRRRERSDSKKKHAARPKRRPTQKPATSQHASGPRPPKFSQAARRRSLASQKPVKPITQQMAQGKEPMRTFSDLLQYYEVKRQGDSSETPDE